DLSSNGDYPKTFSADTRGAPVVAWEHQDFQTQLVQVFDCLRSRFLYWIGDRQYPGRTLVHGDENDCLALALESDRLLFERFQGGDTLLAQKSGLAEHHDASGDAANHTAARDGVKILDRLQRQRLFFCSL